MGGERGGKEEGGRIGFPWVSYCLLRLLPKTLKMERFH